MAKRDPMLEQHELDELFNEEEKEEILLLQSENPDVVKRKAQIKRLQIKLRKLKMETKDQIQKELYT